MLLLLGNIFFIKVFSTDSDAANRNSGAATTKEDGSTRTVNVGRTYNNRVRLPDEGVAQHTYLKGSPPRPNHGP